MNANEIRKEISEEIANALGEGMAPWRKPWSGGENSGNPCNFTSKRRYTGINHLLLSLSSMMARYDSQNWGTASSWTKKLGAHIMKGQKSTLVTFFRMIPKRDPKTKKPELNSNGEQVMIPLLKRFPVFNVEQLQAPTVETLLNGKCGKNRSSIVKVLLGTDNKDARTSTTSLAELKQIAETYAPTLAAKDKQGWAQGIHDAITASLDDYKVILKERNNDPNFGPAEALIKATGADITYEGTEAFHKKGKIQVPDRKYFDSISAFYETVFHELGHWAVLKMGVKEKIKPDNEQESYAFEELVVEIAASYLMAEVNVPLAEKMLENSKSYVSSWLGKMQSDPKYIFEASTYASQVADYLLKFDGKQNPAFDEGAAANQAAA